MDGTAAATVQAQEDEQVAGVDLEYGMVSISASLAAQLPVDGANAFAASWKSLMTAIASTSKRGW